MRGDGSLFGVINLEERRLARYQLTMNTVQEITEAIERLEMKEQVKLMRDLPQRLKISPEDLAWMQLAEPAFSFWDNPEDAIYDTL